MYNPPINPYTESDEEEFGLPASGVYSVDITGFSTYKGMNYGWIGNKRVFIKDNEGRYRPGDSVGLMLTGRYDKGLVGEVKEGHGCFIDEFIREGRPEKLHISGRSRMDARDCFSGCNRGYGFRGIFTILQRTLPDIGKEKDFIINGYGVGKNGKYFATAEPVNPEDALDPERVIFISDWASGNLPEMSGVTQMEGVYNRIFRFLFFGVDGRKYMVDRNGSEEVSQLSDPESVYRYINSMRPDSFRLILDGDLRDSSNSRALRAVERINRYENNILDAQFLHESLF